MLLLATLALATPLDIPRERALALIEACQARDAQSCAAMAASARRAWGQSVVDNAYGNDEIAGYRQDQMRSFLAAGCAAGDTQACRNARDDAAACRLGDDDACESLVLWGTPEDKAALDARCAAAPTSRACGVLREAGWKDGAAWRVTMGWGYLSEPASPVPDSQFLDAEGRRYTFGSWIPLRQGIFLARGDRRSAGVGKQAGPSAVIAWCEPATRMAGTLVELPGSAPTAMLAASADGGFVAWSASARVNRARLVSAAGGWQLVDVRRSMELPNGDGVGWDLAVTPDGRVASVQQGEAALWDPAADARGQPVVLGSGAQQIFALADGRLVVVTDNESRQQVRVFDAQGALTGAINLPFGQDGGWAEAISADHSAVLMEDGYLWTELDFSERAEPAWAIPAERPRDQAPPGRIIQVMDSAGIPIAGLSLDGPAWQSERTTDLLGRGAIERTEWVGGMQDGLERTHVPDAKVFTVRTWSEKRARIAEVGAGMTVESELGTLRVTGMDRDSAWTQVLGVGDAFTPIDPAPAGGWSVDALWAVAKAAWPIRGVAVRRKSDGKVLDLPGGGPCVSRNAPRGSGIPEGMYATTEYDVGFAIRCPEPAAIGTHVQHLSEAEWANADLIGWLDGSWVPLQPKLDLAERVRADLRRRLADPNAAPSPDPKVAIEVAALLAEPPSAREEAIKKLLPSGLNHFTVQVGEHDGGEGTAIWHFGGVAPITASERVVGGIVWSRGDDASNITFVDHDTMLRENFLYVRARP